MNGMEKIGLFYGPSMGSVAKIARMISDKIGYDNVELILAKDATADDVNQFNKIIFGLSTIGKANWDSENVDKDWDLFLTQMDKVNWNDKTVAIYCLGDQLTYPDNFVDGLGWVYERLEKYNAKVVGFCKTEGYQFNESVGIRDNQFLGLPLDEDNEARLSDTRIDNWLKQLKQEGF